MCNRSYGSAVLISMASYQGESCKTGMHSEDSLTKLERLLIDGEKDTLTSVRVDVEQVRDDLDTAIRPLLIEALQDWDALD
jgi:hypothetical protein